MKTFLQHSVNLLPWPLRQRIRLIPGVAAFQRWLIERFLSDREFAHVINAGPARGLQVSVTLPQDKAIWTGTYEAGFAEALASAVRPGDVCYDVGGFRGFMSGVFALAGAKSVVTFEPLPGNVDHLRRLAAMNAGLPLRLQPCAVGEHDGEIEFEVMPEASMGKIHGSPFQQDRSGGATLRVPMRSLDSLVASGELPPPDLMKIDVEGAELSVLEGARNVLQTHRPRLFIEAHSSELFARCSQLLGEFHYHVVVLDAAIATEDRDPRGVCHLRAEPASK